jgi:hypothetical protein
MENKELKWEDVPKGWALCFNRECEMREGCLRFKAGELAPEETTVWPCITPRALKDGECQHFASTEKVNYARGFSHIYDKVLKQDFTPLRKAMTEMLQGKRYYYEYLRGERRLSPRQQQSIHNLFAKSGYAESVCFDGFEASFDFKRP